MPAEYPWLVWVDKDMLDIKATINWLSSKGVKVLGNDRDICDGYVFVGEKVRLSGKFNGSISSYEKLLILNGIASEKRIQDRRILNQAVARGVEAKRKGQSFHPAVNAVLDEMTEGKSGRLQLESLIANIHLAAQVSSKN